MIQISPVRLEQKMERFDVTNAFVCSDDENIVEYERIRNRVRIADRYQDQTQDQCTRGRVVFN